jgi:hypothetical protein
MSGEVAVNTTVGTVSAPVNVFAPANVCVPVVTTPATEALAATILEASPIIGVVRVLLVRVSVEEIVGMATDSKVSLLLAFTPRDRSALLLALRKPIRSVLDSRRKPDALTDADLETIVLMDTAAVAPRSRSLLRLNAPPARGRELAARA